jgi:hypothetical protein
MQGTSFPGFKRRVCSTNIPANDLEKIYKKVNPIFHARAEIERCVREQSFLEAKKAQILQDTNAEVMLHDIAIMDTSTINVIDEEIEWLAQEMRKARSVMSIRKELLTEVLVTAVSWADTKNVDSVAQIVTACCIGFNPVSLEMKMPEAAIRHEDMQAFKRQNGL